MSATGDRAKTAADVAREYSPEADWIPCGRVQPPESETIDVLFADGVTAPCLRVGRMYLIQPSNMYRYVEAAFWRPAK